MRIPNAARLLTLTAMLCGSLALESCTSLLGDFSASKGDASVVGGEAGSDASVEDATVEAGTPDGGLSLGAPCTGGTACPLGFCVDGVCCESACSGVCETCNASGSPGHCTAIAANTDPDRECVAIPVPDAGAVDAGGAAEAGEAGATDAGASDSAVPDAAPEAGFNLPDGGLTSDDTQCAGSCNGSRACAYPDHTKVCGTKFCNSPAEAAHVGCDGTGHCGQIDVSSCTSYACVGQSCGTTCSSPSDCLPTSFCNSSGMCQTRLGNGVACTLGNQCSSDNCVQGVCCSSACNIPGGTCTSSGAIGQCKCSVNCGDGGTCQLFYKDSDGDTYGDKSGTIGSGTAAVGCSGAPPAGFVADNTDCDDHDGNAHPGQTNYYGTPSLGVGTYDYNCDGTQQKSVPEFPGSYCEFCGGTSPNCASQSTCAASGNAAGFNCGSHFRFLCILGGGCNIVYYCANGSASGFTSTIACGATGTYSTCGTCSAMSGYPGVTTSSMQQQCH